jgi:hypothetical protein
MADQVLLGRTVELESIKIRGQPASQQIVLLAIAEDDPGRLRDLQPALSNADIMRMRFENNMNVLNLTLDLAKIRVIVYLSTVLTKQEKLELVRHEFSGISAIHQAISIGSLKLITILLEDF